MKIQQIISLVTENKYYSLYEAQEAIRAIFGTFAIPAGGIDTNEYSTYSVATDVYRCEDGYVGVTGVWRVKQTSVSFESIQVTASASEYKEFATITFVKK